MLTLIAILLGAVVGIASVAVLVHETTAVPPAPTRQLFNYGST